MRARSSSILASFARSASTISSLVAIVASSIARSGAAESTALPPAVGEGRRRCAGGGAAGARLAAILATAL